MMDRAAPDTDPVETREWLRPAQGHDRGRGPGPRRDGRYLGEECRAERRLLFVVTARR